MCLKCLPPHYFIIRSSTGLFLLDTEKEELTEIMDLKQDTFFGVDNLYVECTDAVNILVGHSYLTDKKRQRSDILQITIPYLY